MELNENMANYLVNKTTENQKTGCLDLKEAQVTQEKTSHKTLFSHICIKNVLALDTFIGDLPQQKIKVCWKILFLRFCFALLSVASWELCVWRCAWWRIGFCHLCTTSLSLTFWLSQSSPLQRSASELPLSTDILVPTSTINNALLRCCMYVDSVLT